MLWRLATRPRLCLWMVERLTPSQLTRTQELPHARTAALGECVACTD